MADLALANQSITSVNLLLSLPITDLFRLSTVRFAHAIGDLAHANELESKIVEQLLFRLLQFFNRWSRLRDVVGLTVICMFTALSMTKL